MSDNEKININKFDVPFSVLGGTHMELFGNGKLVFQGKYLISEYTEVLLKVKSNRHTIVFAGTELQLGSIDSEIFVLTGRIEQISFE